MDQAKIGAMRAILRGLGQKTAQAEKFQHDKVYLDDAPLATKELRLGVVGLRELVERAAAERAGGATVSEKNPLVRFIESLKDAAAKADKGCDKSISITSNGSVRSLYLIDVYDVVRAIEALLAAPPAPPTEPAEPTLEECVAAFRRGKVRGNADWHVVVASKFDNLKFFQDETLAIGRLLIARERAEAAKGGA